MRRWLVATALISIGGAPDAAPADGTESARPQVAYLDEKTALRLIVADVPDDAALEASGARIGRIEIRVQNIFDPDFAGEDGIFDQLANGLHIRTRRSVIRDQLLFRSGDVYSARLLAESERLLRQNQYLGEVRIHPIRYEDNRVDIEVVARDTWTLSPKLSFGRRGGENSAAIGIEDNNLLGLGKALTLVERSSVDRDESQLRYEDPHVFGSRVRFSTTVSENSDGYGRYLYLERPFFALDSRWAAGVTALVEDRIDPLYAYGEIADQFRHRETLYEFRRGWSDGLVDGLTRRWSAGVTYERDRFETVPGMPAPSVLPLARTLVYPWVGFELIEDRYRTKWNHDKIGRTEDMFVGRQLSLKLGLADELFGADRRAAIFSASAGIGFEPDRGQMLLLSAQADGRLESDGLRNSLASAAARYYLPDLGRHLFFASFEGRVAHELDVENQLLLGGDSGLRGYPLRYQSGDRSMLLTLEQRFYTDWYPLRLARVGAAVFFDAGQVWGEDALGGATSGLLRDVGFGLRLSSSRSGLGSVLHIDLAFPLDADRSIDGMQLLIQTRTSF